MYDLRIINGECFINNKFVKTNIYVMDESIACINDGVFPAVKTIDVYNLKVLPGLIDPHVHLHLNVGDKYSADDFESGSALAASGGVTTIIDFLDPILENSEFEDVFNKRMEDAKHSCIDYAFHATLGNYQDDVFLLEPLLEDKGISSIKVFTTYASSNRQCSYDVIRELMGLRKVIMVHSEDEDMIVQKPTIETYEQSRSEACEWSAIKKLLAIQRDTSGEMYIVHISSGHSLHKIELGNPNLYLESCPHYFKLKRNLFLEYDGEKYLCAPPIRSQESIELLKKNLFKLDTIGTDHCPFLLDDKFNSKDIDKIPKGIGSLGLAFPIVYEIGGPGVIPKFTSNPAKIFGLNNKGSIEVGKDADFAILDEKEITYPVCNYSQCDYSVYKDPIRSKIVMTLLRGDLIFTDDKVFKKQGHYIRRHHENNHQC